MARAKSGLTEKQERFANEYLIDLNATQAYIRAGYSDKGADVGACNLLANVRVYARVQALLAERGERMKIDQDYVVEGLKHDIKLARKLRQMNAAIKGWELLSKHTGGFVDELKLQGKISFDDIIKLANQGDEESPNDDKDPSRSS